ncbi:hypothetical protein TNCV_4333971 [Trichonephila clavipes]|nr:hypothetical protein TNCV_4333971 [Trichonephila clavipes]
MNLEDLKMIEDDIITLIQDTAMSLYPFLQFKSKVLYIGYVKRGFNLGNSLPSLGELAGSKSAVDLRNFYRSKIRLTSRTQAAPVGLGPFDLLTTGRRWPCAHSKFSDVLSSPNRGKTQAQCYGISC